MDRQTTVALLLIGLILMIWLYWTAPPPPQPKQPNDKDTSSMVTKSLTETKKAKEEEQKEDSLLTSDDSPARIITIETEKVVYEFSTKGGKIVKAYLKEFKNWYNSLLPSDASRFQHYVQLLNATDGGTFDIEFITTAGKQISTGKINFTPSIDKNYITLGSNDSIIISFSYDLSEGKRIENNYNIKGDSYFLGYDLKFHGLEKVISNNTYDIVWDAGIRNVEENSVDEATYSNASIYYGGEQVIIDAPHGNETVQQDFNGRIDWLTIRNKYFAAIMIPHNPDKVDGAFIKGYSLPLNAHGIKEIYSARLKMPFKEQKELNESFEIFLGPVEYDLLKAYGSNLERVVDFGSFFGLKFIVRPIAEYVLLPLFKFLHGLIPNYGIVIIIFSLILKLAMHPLTKQTFSSMRKMQALQPKIQEIKEKFKDDPQKVQKETMKLYQTYGINPAGGCLPMLLQMPIFIALWGVFQTAIELRQQPFIWWITDLSRPDVILDLGFSLPIFGISQISGLALAMGVTQFFQQYMTMKDPQQKMLVYIMPIMLTLIFMSFPSGLNLYYFMFNLFSIVHQVYIKKYGKEVELQPVKNPKKGFMARMMEAAEQNAKNAQQQRKKK